MSKTEVFIAYDDDSSLKQLGDTLDAWDTEWFEPVAIHVKNVENETMIQVAAEAICKADYMIVKLGTKPAESGTYPFIKKGSIKVEPCSPRVQ